MHLRLLIIYLKALLPRYMTGTLFLLLTNGFALLIPWFMKLSVEGIQNPAGARFTPAACALIIVFLAVGHCVARIYSRTVILNAARVLEFRIREKLFNNLLRLDLQFYSKFQTGDILSRFSNDLTNVRMLTGFGILSVINSIILYSAAVSLMVRIHPQLTFLAILPFPLMILIVKKLSYKIFKRSLSAQEELASLTSRAEESLSAIRVIRSCCREEYFERMFGETAERYLHFNLKIARLRGFIIPVMAGATGAGTLITLFMGGRLVIQGVLTLGDFVAFGGYLAMLVWPTAIMGWIISLAQRGAASMSRLAEILQAEPGVRDLPDPEIISSIEKGIELRNLSIRYGEKKLLDGISLFIAPGERIGITGDVGSGKSTLLRTIVRLMPVTNGMIFLDGKDVNRVSLASLHSLIGYVPQEAILFSRSIEENISFGIPADGHADLEQAAAKADFLDDITRFPNGMNTLVGERGITLSGGQKQRLSIARALVGEPQILLLDDPLSAVDAGKEDEILRQLGIFFHNRTVLVVSQRVSVFRECDRVIVLKEGKIAEQGSPAELLESGGLYAAMFRTQQLQEELG